MELYNKLSDEERAALIRNAGKERLTLSFYKYEKIGNPELFRNYIFTTWNPLDALGRIYIAKEGINAQLSLPAANFDSFKAHLDSIPFLENIRLNIALEQNNFSFLKLKIKVRDKIVADGLNDTAFDVTDSGTHLDAAAFNAIMEDPDTVLVDMRNHYESEIGHFKNAITPDVDTFRDSLPIIEAHLKEYKKDKNVVMYCTGGIRCEKASAYFKYRGFKKVYQLEGGIINYAHQVAQKQLENKFIGKNFVFDGRHAERVSDDVIAHCHQCGTLCDTHVNCANKACNLLFIQCQACTAKTNRTCSARCMHIAALPYQEQKSLRSGKYKSCRIYKKGRFSEG